jgi:3-dehydrosphinganine reductase
MKNYFQNKRVLITGGSSGIGCAIAKQLAASSAHVWILARRPEMLAKAAQEIEQRRVSPQQVVGTLSADVSNEAEITAKLSEFCATAGVPDILINCAGIAHPGKFEETDSAIFRSMMETNYFGMLYPIKAVVPGMIQRKSGHIVNFGSLAGILGVYGYTAYGASKAAIRGFSSALRDEMRLYGVHVSVVYPTDTQTPQLDYEKPLEPAITKILAGSKPITADYAARVILDGVARHRFAITPGFDATLYFLALSVAGWLEKPIMDFLVDDAQKKIKSVRA